MSAAPLTAAERLQQMRLTVSPNIQYDLDSVFPKVNGWLVKGPIKRKHKLIVKVEPTLEEILRPGEEVLYIAKGVQYSFWEQYFLGAWAALINQTVFVLTNVRLLMLHSNTKGKPKDMSWMIYYSQITHFKSGWFGAVVVKLRDGKTFKYGGFTGADRKQMPKVFQQVANAYKERGFDPNVSQSRENLCYHCYSIIAKKEYVCSKCGAEYWQPSQIAWRSLMFPSWGDFLMRHYLIGLLELGGYLFGWFAVVTLWIGALGAADPSVMAFAAVITALFLIPAHGVDAILTYYIANKGLNRRLPPDPSRVHASEYAEIEVDGEPQS
ncbi:MAG: hypothetical protein JWM11_4422 [Planctomycetaceae bacterium]|nr:hypothetical protein [Planctomycetaceae bacterium]